MPIAEKVAAKVVVSTHIASNYRLEVYKPNKCTMLVDNQVFSLVTHLLLLVKHYLTWINVLVTLLWIHQWLLKFVDSVF